LAQLVPSSRRRPCGALAPVWQWVQIGVKTLAWIEASVGASITPPEEDEP
jgi:hypothetical protein